MMLITLMSIRSFYLFGEKVLVEMVAGMLKAFSGHVMCCGCAKCEKRNLAQKKKMEAKHQNKPLLRRIFRIKGRDKRLVAHRDRKCHKIVEYLDKDLEIVAICEHCVRNNEKEIENYVQMPIEDSLGNSDEDE